MTKNKNEHTLNVRFPESWRQKIRIAAAEQDKSMNAWITEAIREKLERQDKNPQ